MKYISNGVAFITGQFLGSFSNIMNNENACKELEDKGFSESERELFFCLLKKFSGVFFVVD
jgi:hypothetical protein